MGIITEAMRDLASVGRKLNNGPFPAYQGYNLIKNVTGERDYRRDIGNGEGSSLIQAVIGYYARTFPEAPVQLSIMKDDKEDIQFSHPMLDLLDKPNQFYSGVILWMASMVSWITDGNVYWRKIRTNAGGPVELWYTPHWMMEPRWSNKGDTYIDYYEYSPGGPKSVELAVEDVVHFRYGLDPQNTRKGMSWVKVLLRELYTDEEAARFAASMLRNMGIVGLVLSPESSEDSPNQDDVEALKTLVAQRTTGDERGKPIVSNVPIKVIEFGSPAAQMDTSKLRAVPESRVAALSGIPAAVLGFLSGMQQTTVGATLSELRELAYESAIIGTHRIFSQDLRTQLLDDFVDDTRLWRVGWDYSKVRVLQEDEDKKWSRVTDAVNRSVLKLSEGRTVLGQEVSPNENVYLRPLAMVEVRAVDVGTFQQATPDPGAEVPSEGDQGGPPPDDSVPQDN